MQERPCVNQMRLSYAQTMRFFVKLSCAVRMQMIVLIGAFAKMCAMRDVLPVVHVRVY